MFLRDRRVFSCIGERVSDGKASCLHVFQGSPRLAGDTFTLVANIRAASQTEFMDFMSWGNPDDIAGQRTREFSLRHGCLEYGQYDGLVWSAVRAESRIDDGIWHLVAVTKHGRDVHLYVDGYEVARSEQTMWARISLLQDSVHVQEPVTSSGMRHPQCQHLRFRFGLP